MLQKVGKRSRWGWRTWFCCVHWFNFRWILSALSSRQSTLLYSRGFRCLALLHHIISSRKRLYYFSSVTINMLFIVSLLVEVSHGPFRSCCHQALIYSGVIVTVVQEEKPSNPTLPVFAFFGQEAVWALRSKTCSHPLIKVWGGGGRSVGQRYSTLEGEGNIFISTCSDKGGQRIYVWLQL